MSSKWINNFTGGEFTPYLDGRTDLDKYSSACRTMENMRPLPYGGAKIRGGLKWIAEISNSAYQARVVPFNFSTGTSFVVEMGHLTMRFFSNDTQVQSGGSPYEVTSPYPSTDIYSVQFKQVNDVIYMTHPYHPSQKLSRIADDNWTLTDVDWTFPPMREENLSAVTMQCNAVSGTGKTLTASAPSFNANMVGGYFEIRHLRAAGGVTLSTSGASGTTQSSVLTVKGNWNVVTTERWNGTLKVERSEDAGASWETIREYGSESDRNVTASGNQITEAQLRLNYTAAGNPYGSGVWAGTPPVDYVYSTAKLESEEAYKEGLVKITGYTSTTVVTVTVVNTLTSTSATDIWSEGAWSVHRGFPRCLGIYEQRLYFGGSIEKPTRFWGSVTGDFENFAYSDDDDAAISFDVVSTESNPLNWIEALQKITMGSAGGEFSVSAGSAQEPVTPSNISVRGQSGYGSELYQPLVVNDVVIFLQRGGKKIREMSFDLGRDGFVAPDLTLMAEHITGAGIYQLGLSKTPDPTIFAVTGGELAVLTYNREQNVTAWSRYVVTDGWIESVCGIYKAGAPDQVYAVIRRTINGSLYRSIEIFTVESDVPEASTYLDAHVAGTLTDPFSGTIGGLGHLEAEVVTLVVAGGVVGTYTVASGAITVPVADVPLLGFYVVGLPYTAKLQPMKMDTVDRAGPTQGKTRRISSLSIRFKSTVGCKYGPALDKLDDLSFRTTNDLMDEPPPVFTGEKKVYFNGGNNKTADLFIVQEEPLPFTVLGIAVEYDVFDR